MTAASHPFDDAIAAQAAEPGRLRGRTLPAWANMVGPFGGITAAALLHAVQLQPERAGDPLALTVNFAAPIAEGDYAITARVARTNRTNQHWLLELDQDGEVKTTASAVFGVHRDTWADTEAVPPAAAPPERIAATGLPDGIEWARRYDMRFVAGPVPLGGRAEADSTTTLWVRDAAGRPLDFAALAAVCDVFYPRVFLRRGTFLPAGTISLTTYFHTDAAELDAVGGDFVLASARAHRFNRGYFDQSAHVWSRSGRLLASTHQLVYFKG
ncbi:acyl-CoA thioesterase [Mycobacterium sp. 1274756.6]|nr:acyl-CoA thioesterase [Mycobacterium sp. 1274756.6]